MINKEYSVTRRLDILEIQLERILETLEATPWYMIVFGIKREKRKRLEYTFDMKIAEYDFLVSLENFQ